MTDFMESRPIQLLDSVALLQAAPSDSLAAGQVGAVVEVYSPDEFEVEFVDLHGRTLGLRTCHRRELLLLQHESLSAA
jgi:hypothetical protein